MIRPSSVALFALAFGSFLVLSMTNNALASRTAPAIDSYDVVWTTPSADSRGSMPLGNGTVGVNAWVEPGGDLQFYISRSDSYSEVSRLLKVGLVHVSLSPNPFAVGQPFTQHLHLRDGVIEIAAGAPGSRCDLKLFVDADQPVIHVAGKTDVPTRVTVTSDAWRTATHALSSREKEASWTMNGAPFPLVESADIFPGASREGAAARLANTPHELVWYRRNETSCVPSTLELQGLSSAAASCPDPLLLRTFGGLVTGDGFEAADGHALTTREPSKAFDFRVACPCAQTKTADEWVELASSAASASADAGAAERRTREWWHRYWDAAWIQVTGDTPLKTEGVEIPGSDHPLRVGYDSDGGNKFPGEIGRTDVYDRALSPEEIRQLATGPRGARASVADGLIAETDGKPGETTPQGALRHGMTLAAWIKPDRLTDGRIFDRITAGQRDGFLFDTHPGDTLRFIVGQQELDAPSGILKSGAWQFVTATVDPTGAKLTLAIDGKIVAGQAAGTGGAHSITQGYLLQRYMQACGGRGPFPIKFNGGQFTVGEHGAKDDADWRRWGDSHWWQNVRLMYHPMLAEGDFSMMDPLFHMYESAVPLAEERSRLIEHVEGAYFPETMTVWGTYANSDFGWDRTNRKVGEVASPWWAKTRNQGPELVALMLDRWDYTQDREFLRKRLLPMATAVLIYFDQRFARDSDGKIVLDPTQAVETFWTGVVDDTPTVAGLINVSQRLTALPHDLTTPEQRALFARIAAACPAVPLEERNGPPGGTQVIAPARKYDPKRTNVENPETYAIWPFRLYGIGKPGLEMARWTYTARVNHLPVGWGYDGNCAAVLGLADEAASILQQKCDNSNPEYRWPATWGPNFDWLPDQNHGGNLLETAQLMLLQSDGRKILLFPAWPKTWDADFKLHAAYNTTVEATLKDGKLTRLVVTPESRKADVVNMLGGS